MKNGIILIIIVTIFGKAISQAPLLNGKLVYSEFNDLQNPQTIKSIRQFVTFVKDSNDLNINWAEKPFPHYYLQNAFCEFDKSMNIIIYSNYNYIGVLVKTDTNFYQADRLVDQVKYEAKRYNNINYSDSVQLDKTKIHDEYGINGRIAITTTHKAGSHDKEIKKYFYKDSLLIGHIKRQYLIQSDLDLLLNGKKSLTTLSSKIISRSRNRHKMNIPNQRIINSRLITNHRKSYDVTKFQLIANKWEVVENKHKSGEFNSTTQYQYLDNEIVTFWKSRGAWDSTFTKYDNYNRIIFQTVIIYRDHEIFHPYKNYNKRFKKQTKDNNSDLDKALINEARYVNLSNTYNFKYTLDQNMNWIKLEYFKNGVLSWIIERKYEYF